MRARKTDVWVGSRGRGSRVAMIVGVAIVAMVTRAGWPADAPEPAEQILQYLNRTVDWYRRVTSLDAAQVRSGQLLFRESTVTSARRVVRLGVDAARAQAELLTAVPATGPTTRPGQAGGREQRLAQSATAAAERVNEVQSRLDQVDRERSAAQGEVLRLLTAQREALLAEMELAKARRDVLQHLAGVSGGGGDTSAGGLLEKIGAIARSVPELRADSVTPANPEAASAGAAVATAAAAQQQVFRVESAGLLQLITEMFALSGRMSELRGLENEAEALKKENEKARAPLRTALIELSRRGDAVTAVRDETDPAKLDAQRREVEGLAVRFRQMAAAGVPLGEQAVVLDATRATLTDWHGALARDYARALRHLLVRLTAIGIAVAVVIGISILWRRATFRYVHEVRRRRQFMLLRRIVIGVLLGLVILVGLVTEFGSVATFAGILTAGIAVALQTVILSGVAYFFFTGRYGVRVGDRVTVGGVTGDVIETGLFRLYLMELGGAQKQRPTGRIVVFSNSVLFQPSGFFKQVPGTDYAWHEIALTLAPDSDYQLAESRLLGAVESVYAQFREEVERQYAAARRTSPLPLETPKPEGRLRFVDAGLEFTLRYPVEMRRAAELDDLITRRLLESIDREPKLRMVSAGTPRIQAAG